MNHARFGSLGASMLLLIATAAAGAEAGGKLQAAGKAASGVAVKTENFVKRGLSTAASAVERGAKAAGRTATAGAKKIGVPGAGASTPRDPSRDGTKTR